MTIQETQENDIGELKRMHLSQTGNTYGIDFMIGNKDYLGLGYGAKTLEAFVSYFSSHIDLEADTFWVDPVADNTRAVHVYKTAGFKHAADFVMGGNYSGSGKQHALFLKKVETD